MAVTTRWYLSGLVHLDDDVDWSTDTIKVTLHSSAYTPSQDADEFFTAATSELATGNGYTAGGATLASKTRTTDAGTNEVRYDAADVAWTPGAGETLVARYAVVRKDTGTAGTSPLLAYIDFGADVSATGAAFTLLWDATGVLKGVV